MAGIDWLAATPAWTRYLRDQGYRLTVGDDLRVGELARKLKEIGLRVADAAAAARWFGPVVCRGADDQSRLARLLAGWAQQYADGLPPVWSDGALRETAALGEGQQLPERVDTALRETARLEAGGPRSWPRWWIGTIVTIAAIVITAGLLVFVSTRIPSPSVTSPLPAAADSVRSAGFAERVIAGVVVLAPFVLAVRMRRSRQRRRAAVLRGLAPRD